MSSDPAAERGIDDPPEGLYRYDRTANKRVATVDDVAEEELGFFQEHGYLVVEEFLDEREIEAAVDGMLSLLADRPDPDLPDDVIQFADALDEEVEDPAAVPPSVAQDYVRKFWRFSEHSQGMYAPAERDDLGGLLSELVGGDPDCFQEMALVKPPDRGGEKPWHQDKAYFDVSLDAPVVGVWIALDEASAENGCMHVIPGSHRDGPVVHFDRRDWQICDTDVQVDEDVMVPLEPGGALLFDGLIHHGTPPNRSSNRRRALQFHFTAADAEWVNDGHPEFDSEGRDVEC